MAMARAKSSEPSDGSESSDTPAPVFEDMGYEEARAALADVVAALDWIDQEVARQLSPMAEAVANMFMVLYYQAETGQATRDDFRQALDAVRQSLTA